MQDEKLQIAKKVIEGLKTHYKFNTYDELADFLGVPIGTLGSWRSRGGFKEDVIIAKCKNISLSWLKTAKGKMFDHKSAQVVAETGENYAAGGAKVGVYALAGAGGPMDLVGLEPIEEITIPEAFHKPSIRTIKVRGKSMEPIILDGAYVGIDRDDRRIVSGEIYAVWLPYEGAVVKRVYMDMERITLKSDNPKFPDIVVQLVGLDDNFIQGRVRWVIQML